MNLTTEMIQAEETWFDVLDFGYGIFGWILADIMTESFFGDKVKLGLNKNKLEVSFTF